MNIIVLAAGRGQRFRDAGYTDPKPLLVVNGLPMVVRCTDSLRNIMNDVLLGSNPEFTPEGPRMPPSEQNNRFAIAYLDEDGTQTPLWEGITDAFYNNSDGVELIKFDRLTKGNLDTAAQAAYIAVNERGWDKNDPILFLDADNTYNSNGLDDFLDELPASGHHAALCYFQPIDRHARWCFAELYMFNLKVKALREKSEEAMNAGWLPVLGTFYFSSTRLFLDTAGEILTLTDMAGPNHEYYMSRAYELLLKRGISVYAKEVTDVKPLGTPEDLRRFERGPIRISVDLDDTINYCKKKNESYGHEEAQKHAIETLKMWRRRGYYIIINTARHMNTCHGNQGKVLARLGLRTLQWLEDNEVPYDEIWWSKPHADVFIDDKAFRHKIGNWDRTGDWIDDFASGDVK